MRILILLFALIVTEIAAAAELSAAEIDVDAELLIAADVSESMHIEIGRVQREGYAAALRSEAFRAAVSSGPHRQIALAYIEWGDAGRIEVVIPWTLIRSRDEALVVADRLENAKLNRFLKTSISHALKFGQAYFAANIFNGPRVIDISGNGPNNQGKSVTEVRDQLVADGVTINGLPILAGIVTPKGAFDTGFDLRELDRYYADCVIGGPGAFMLPVREMNDFTRAVERKLVLEIAQLVPPEARPPSAVSRAGC